MTKGAQDRRLQRKRELAKAARRRARRMRLVRIWASVAAALLALALIFIFTKVRGTPTAKATPQATLPLNASPPKGVKCKGPSPSPGTPKTYPSPPPTVVKPDRKYEVSMVTTCGNIKMVLDPKLAPKAVNNFVFLAREGFYNGLTFHRLEKNPPFQLVQGGDPTGDGTGGPGYQFEIEKPPAANGEYLKTAGGETYYVAGAVAMANASQPNTNGSQFFLVYKDVKLRPDYTVLGKTDKASEATLAAMMQAPADGSKPRPKIWIVSVTVKEI